MSDSTKESKETANALFKRLQGSALQGQPLLPFIFHNTDFESSINKENTDKGGHRTTPNAAIPYWEVSPSVPSPSAIFASNNLRTVQRLVLKQWAPRAVNGADLLKDCLANRRFLSTGFSQLDSLLNGGLMTGEITEIFGASAVGKTQMCHCVTADVVSSYFLQPDTSTSESPAEIRGPTVLYLDTKGDFDAVRLRDITRYMLKRKYHLEGDANDFNQKRDHCLCRVWHRLVPEVQSLMDGLVETRLCLASAAMQDLPTNRIQLTPEEKNFYSHLRLVIVDSIAAPFAPYISLFTMETTFQLQLVATELRRISTDLHVAVLVTNNLRYGAEVPHGSLGEFWSTVPHISLYMHSSKTPLQVSIEIRRNLRFTDANFDCIADEGEEEKPLGSCIVNFSDTWEKK